LAVKASILALTAAHLPEAAMSAASSTNLDNSGSIEAPKDYRAGLAAALLREI
jgi:hypothetical protein